MRAIAMAVAAIVACALGDGVSAHAQPAPFRVGHVARAPADCAPASATSPGGQRAYAEHLERRIGAPVQFCAFVSVADASAALAAGKVDVAPMDRTVPASARTTIRPILTGREGTGPGRVLTSVSVLATSNLRTLQDLRGKRVAFGGATAFALERPLLALTHHGLDLSAVSSKTVAVDPVAAASALRSGSVDAIVLYAAARQRMCRGNSPAEKPCADLREIWLGRPGVQEALAVRLDMPAELRFRFIGVHTALHLENRAAFDWIAPGAAELQPIEADAVFVDR